MSTEGRQLVFMRTLRTLDRGFYLRVEFKSVQPLVGSVVEVWENGRGPTHVTVAQEVHRNKLWIYYAYTRTET